jgi:hypothetical protein
MFVDQNQIYGDKILGGPKINELNHLKSTWTLPRSVIRKQKIEKIYGTKNSNRKEK